VKGRDRFTGAEATEIRRPQRLVRAAEAGTPQKRLRYELRARGFYISDWGTGGVGGFTASDFDELVHRGVIGITADAAGEHVQLEARSPASAPRQESGSAAARHARPSSRWTRGLR
jgi:hypothetical protein